MRNGAAYLCICLQGLDDVALVGRRRSVGDGNMALDRIAAPSGPPAKPDLSAWSAPSSRNAYIHAKTSTYIHT